MSDEKDPWNLFEAMVKRPAPSEQDSRYPEFERLRRLGGFDSVDDMWRRWRQLAGVEPA